MRFLLLHTAGYSPDGIAAALAAEEVDVRAVGSVADIAVAESPTALLLDPSARDALPTDCLAAFARDGGAVIVLGREGERDLPDGLDAEWVGAFVPHPHPARSMFVALRTAFREAAARRDAWSARREASSRARELAELTRIGMALSTERDYNTLLELILRQALEITGSDAGSLYIVEKSESMGRHLRFKLSQNQSRPDIPFVEVTMPLDVSSI
ncbi:MAG: hypothetical protein IH616_19255, partial [Gemmatimonadales bacterium]|nr:hypothetical protein [Gemmatimonadales bacterium]